MGISEIRYLAYLSVLKGLNVYIHQPEFQLSPGLVHLLARPEMTADGTLDGKIGGFICVLIVYTVCNFYFLMNKLDFSCQCNYTLCMDSPHLSNL